MKERLLRFFLYSFGIFSLGLNGYMYFRYGYVLPKLLLFGVGGLAYAFFALREDTLSF